jgi:hypothetical protein
MDPESLLAAYPTVRHAVAFVEFIVCGVTAPGEESGWHLMMSAVPPITLELALACLKDAAEGSIIDKVPEARTEMDRPEFLTYLKGKLGLM